MIITMSFLLFQLQQDIFILSPKTIIFEYIYRKIPWLQNGTKY